MEREGERHEGLLILINIYKMECLCLSEDGGQTFRG